MNKLAKDKIIMLLGSGLLGYYLSISVFRNIIWNRLLLKALPPINPRHLPDGYVGILGALILALLGYAFFALFIEKKRIAEHKRQYLSVLVLLMLMPVIIAGMFRWQAVAYVQRAENTRPTEITIRLNTPGSQIMFKTSPTSARGVGKEIAVDKYNLEAMGQMISDMKLQEVVPAEEQLLNPIATLFVNYRVDGRWYSKILVYGAGFFEESVAHNRFARYVNSDLERTLLESIREAGSLSHYSQAKIMNSRSVTAKQPEVQLTKEQLAKLAEYIKGSSPVEPEPAVKAKFENILQDGVSQNDADIYAVHLLRKVLPNKYTVNFIVYDKPTKTLLFEGQYYRRDIDEIIDG